ncbi:hypothetical protein FGB62_12g421 [Gracilaria domingensis]|nr:hypothetical protein FGB62_216g039 [Gracilaria domingensis]KAI0564164.1 hypothetical protein FGB62_30g119 [Gracilaria domingensis]KAI0566065.1 hypothetical protein FGB62_12g421 [Gracilaria domingensis]
MATSVAIAQALDAGAERVLNSRELLDQLGESGSESGLQAAESVTTAEDMSASDGGMLCVCWVWRRGAETNKTPQGTAKEEHGPFGVSNVSQRASNTYLADEHQAFLRWLSEKLGCKQCDEKQVVEQLSARTEILLACSQKSEQARQ